MKWEYKVIYYKTRERLSIDELNKLGDDGWELIIYFSDTEITYPVAIFKRPKNQG